MLIYNQKLAVSPITTHISLNQVGFPIATAELRSSPLVIDLDSDGELEIIIGDNNGFVRIYDINAGIV